MSSSSAESKMALAKTVLSTVGSVAATAMLVRTIVHDYIPPELHQYLYFGLRNIFTKFSNQLTMVIDEFDGLVNNEIYEAAVIYLGNKLSPNIHRLKVSKPEKEKNFNITMERNEEVIDVYNGQTFKWIWLCKHTESKHFYNPRDMNSTLKSEIRSFELTFHKKNKDLVLNSYLPYIMKEAKLQKHENKTIKIHTVDYEAMCCLRDMWKPVNLDHPATFETIAMESDQKDMILKDLERFVKRKEHYRKVGKAWKRGYLLYGPPGTGKSSLIAAMANYLNFDIYDLELTDLRRNSELRKLLVGTANKSILVVEDIDCTIDLQDNLANRAVVHSNGFNQQESKVTLSGLLNFIDGLWSSCGDERIIIFTTNHVEKLDPALLRPGRMDVHIHMAYCTPCGFKLLAANYLGIKDHKMFKEIEELIDTANVTPAEVAEQLLKEDEVEDALKGLINFLHKKIQEKEEEKAKKVEITQVKSVDEKKESDENGIKENEEEKGLPNGEVKTT
ncbi:AAA-ATPase At3g50940-like [Lycium ferocissimum]|uniref:AAA-ATPase At3g50940-like n=1 Tax=Lycium ferocissimum TaxID=112874 RepID=UPI002816814B|nr:AAA-ATPase At3g50940-like [Lycium ferocissimum]